MNIEPIRKKDLEITVKDNTIIIDGEIDQKNPEYFLTPFFNKVLSQMQGTVILDLRKLTFLNSSGVKSIISFLLKRNPQNKIIMKSNAENSWQRNALKIVASLDQNIRLEYE